MLRAGAFFLIWGAIWVGVLAAETMIFPSSSGAIGGTIGFFAGVIVAGAITGVVSNRIGGERETNNQTSHPFAYLPPIGGDQPTA